jgi:CDP-diacylglycerol--glycerol-3-phosphate 3-phosphatidyltransferase
VPGSRRWTASVWPIVFGRPEAPHGRRGGTPGHSRGKSRQLSQDLEVAVLDGRWRTNIEKALKPVGVKLLRLGFTADRLTALGVGMSACAAVAVATGHLSLGVLFLVLTGLPDALDGAVAKAAGTAGPRGAFFDSVADRVSDTMLLGGVAWYLADTHPGLLPLLPMAVLGASLIISYERAKAEALGFNAKGGVMERAEIVTAVQRFVKVWRQASQERPVQPVNRRAARRRAARASRGTSSVWRQNLQSRRRR